MGRFSYKFHCQRGLHRRMSEFQQLTFFQLQPWMKSLCPYMDKVDYLLYHYHRAVHCHHWGTRTNISANQLSFWPTRRSKYKVAANLWCTLVWLPSFYHGSSQWTYRLEYIVWWWEFKFLWCFFRAKFSGLYYRWGLDSCVRQWILLVPGAACQCTSCWQRLDSWGCQWSRRIYPTFSCLICSRFRCLPRPRSVTLRHTSWSTLPGTSACLSVSSHVLTNLSGKSTRPPRRSALC